MTIFYSVLGTLVVVILGRFLYTGLVEQTKWLIHNEVYDMLHGRKYIDQWHLKAYDCRIVDLEERIEGLEGKIAGLVALIDRHFPQS